MDDLSQQIDEIEALTAIYGNEFTVENEADRSYRLRVYDKVEVLLYVTLPSDYPSVSPPQFQLSAPELSKSTKQRISLALNDTFLDNIGEPVLFAWVEKIREILAVNIQYFDGSSNDVELSANEESTLEFKEQVSGDQIPIFHGPLIQDRKSTFQGHAAICKSKKDFELFMEIIMENKKIASATHNIMAYRIGEKEGICLQDCDDDGETHAGSRLLHLLCTIGLLNVAVVVTRWYGGVHLGPDRFRHINNAARQVLQVAGLISSQ